MMPADKKKHRRNLVMGGVLLALCVISLVLTAAIVYLNASANQHIEEVRQEYRSVADRRDEKVSALGEQVGRLQQKIDSLPGQTADKVKQAVKEEDKK